MRRDGTEKLANTSGVTSIPVASTGTAYSRPFRLQGAVKFGIELTATSSGAVDVVVELEGSSDGTNFKEPDGASDLINLTDEVAHIKSFADAAIPATKWGRLKFTGQGSNHASTVVAGYINVIRDEQGG